jgi:hypothetical protein
MLEFKQSEQTATKRIWFFQLTNIAPASEVPSGLKNNSNVTYTVLNPPQYLTLNGQTLTAGTDYTVAGLTITMITPPLSTDVFLSWYANAPLIGQTGHGYLSTNGGAGVSSINTFIEIDSVNMPGSYYLQLAQSEVATLGSLNLYVKTTQSNAFNAQAIISYNDPYASQGGFVAPSNVTGMGLPKAQADDLLKKIRKMIAEEFAKEEEEEDAEEVVEQKDYDAKLDAIMAKLDEPEEEVEETPDRTDEVLEAIAGIEKPLDFTPHFKKLGGKVDSVIPQYGDLKTVAEGFQGKMSVATDSINGSLITVKEISDGFAELKKMMDEFKSTLADQSDMDKRFDAMTSGKNDKKLEELSGKFIELQKMVINAKYDILQELTKANKVKK